ncbi:MAG: hypothetical protein V4612_00155 [Pseudomonadota bacterium]
MKDQNNNQANDKINNEIWYNFFVRSANSLVFDLLDNLKQVQKFSTEQLYILTAICDNIANKSKDFKEELAKRVGK